MRCKSKGMEWVQSKARVKRRRQEEKNTLPKLKNNFIYEARNHVNTKQPPKQNVVKQKRLQLVKQEFTHGTNDDRVNLRQQVKAIAKR